MIIWMFSKAVIDKKKIYNEFNDTTCTHARVHAHIYYEFIDMCEYQELPWKLDPGDGEKKEAVQIYI